MGTNKRMSGNRINWRKLFCLLIFLTVCSSLTLPLLAEDQIVFGPEDLRIGWFHVHFSFHTFEVNDAEEGIIAITKITPEKTIHGGFLCLNGKSMPLEDFFGSEDLFLNQLVNLRSNNYILVFLRGDSGASISMEVKKQASTDPPDVSFSADPEFITRGQSIVLSWTTTNATSVSIEPGIGSVATSGTRLISPSETTTYTVTASGSGGSATDSVTVTVTSPPAPTVSISANPATIVYGESATLSWSSTHADAAAIDQAIGEVDVNGSITVSPQRTATYNITVSGPGGTASSQAVVAVTADVEPQPAGSFGAQYEDLVPLDATIEAYDPGRFSVITGVVNRIDGFPISDVVVTILDHPEYGTAHTDSNGRFSVPVEGGSTYTVVYQKEGLTTSHRKVYVPWKDIAVAETIQLILEDPEATTVTFDGNFATVIAHESTEVTDEFGSRSATMVFTGDNRAYEVDAQGNVNQELTTITTRATEFPTPESMPAVLPPTSAFTYCVELSVDGVKRVKFDKPVIIWVDNFLGFDVGEIAPVGSYDRNKGAWIAEENGVVVRLLDTVPDGIVDALDSDGDGQPNDLDGDGSFSDEVIGLNDAERYAPGSTFWRVALSHFTAIDINWPPGFPIDAIAANPDGEPDIDQQCSIDCITPTGSFVEDRSRIFHEDVAIPGTDMSLHYASNRVSGYGYKIKVPASASSVPQSLKSILVRVEVAGQFMEQELPPLPDQMAEFIWDRRDHLGRVVTNRTIAHIAVGFVYDAVYFGPRVALRSFALAGVSPTGVPARQELVSWKLSDVVVQLGAADGMSVIAEGWIISSHHHLDSAAPTTLHKGDGTILQKTVTIETMAGTGPNCTYYGGYGGDGGPATQAQLDAPWSIAADAEGNIYVVDYGNERVRKVDPSGIITTVAGNGTRGYGGDGGPATQAQLNAIRGVAVDAAGNIYLADLWNHRIRKVDTSGIITTVAGSGPMDQYGNGGFSGDDGSATEAYLNMPEDVAADAEGNIYIADSNNRRIRKVDPSGTITTIAGGGSSQDDGIPATQAYLDSTVLGVAVDRLGSIYIIVGGSSSSSRIRKVDPSGIITTIAGGGSSYNDGIPAIQARLEDAAGVAVDGEGNVYIAERGLHYGAIQYGNRIRKVDTSGMITTVAGISGSFGFTGDGGPANEAQLCAPGDVTVDAEGNLYIADSQNHRIRKVGLPAVSVASMAPGDILFAEEYGLGHILSSAGRHKTSIDLDTGLVHNDFGYDEDDRLVAITDQHGKQTIIERDSAGVPTAIISPDGLTTTFAIDSNNHLARVTYPDGAFYGFEYTPGGLMNAKIEPEGNRFEHVFDSIGRLTNATDEEGGNWHYSRAELANGEIRTEVLTGEGNLTTYLDHTDSTGAYTSTITDPTDAQTVFNQSADGLTVSKSLPCGMDLEFKYDLDSEYKFKYVKEMKESTPAALEKVTLKGKNYQDTDSDEVPDLITETVTVNGKATSLVTNTLQAAKTLTSPEGRTVTTSYDPHTLLTTSLTTSGLHPTAYGYDHRGRLVSIDTNSRHTAFSYDGQGNLASITDPENQTTTYSYDEVGRMTGINRPDGSFVGFTHDKNGNMTVLANPSGITHGFAYNGVNLNSVYGTPLSGSYSYMYDKDRRLTQINFPSGRQIKNVYAEGRLERIQTPEGSVDLTYVCGSKVDTVTRGVEQIAYGHDGSLVTSEIMSGTLNQSLGYGYSNDFSLNSFTYAGGRVDYTYDNDGLLTGVGSFIISRNVGNGLPETLIGGALSLSRTFNGYGEVAAQDFKVGGQGVTSWSLTSDNAGRITAKTETVDGVTSTYSYTYDPKGRLLTVIRDGDLVEEYHYNNIGTRIYEMNARRTIAGRTLTYDDEDHLMTAGDATYQYDLDGYLTTKTIGTETTNYGYSSRGELLNVTLPDGRIIEYIHDPLGRRIAKKVNGAVNEKYLWQGLTRLLAVYDGNDNLVIRFLYTDGRMPAALEKGAETYYLTYDQVGSLRAVADSSGSVVKRIDYDSFGSVINDTNPAFVVPFGFAGGLQDRDTGLVRFGFRDYDPDVGRWTAKDPILFAGGNVDLYGYCLNDPINWVDPDGLILPGPTGALGGAIVGGISGAITGAIVAGKEVGWKGAVLGAVGGGVAGVASGLVGGLVTGTLKGGIIGGVAGNLVGALIGEMLSPISISEYGRTHMIRKSIPKWWQIRKPIPRPNAPC